MGPNLYSGRVPFTKAGRFGRCRHGHTLAMPCWRCGWLYPLRWLRHLWVAAH